MNSNVKNFFLMLLAIVVGIWLIRFTFDLLVGVVWHVLVPVAIVGGVLYLGYVAFGRKALGGGGRRYLP